MQYKAYHAQQVHHLTYPHHIARRIWTIAEHTCQLMLGAPRWNAAGLGPAGSRRAALECAFPGDHGERARTRVRLGASLAPALATIFEPVARDRLMAVCTNF